MRVVAWNMEHKPGPAWALLDGLAPDIALLTEAVVPSDRAGVWRQRTVGRDGSTHRNWSAAAVSEHPSTEIVDARPAWRGHTREVPFSCSRTGTWVASQVMVPEVGQVAAVALYGLMDEFSDASMHRSLSELSPLIDDSRYNKHLLIGGDFNTGTQWPKGDPFLARDANVLARLKSWGLVDCVIAKRQAGRLKGCACSFGDECQHVRTRRHKGREHVPYQVDYLYASPALAERLLACDVHATDEWFAVSDHAPIVAEFQ